MPGSAPPVYRPEQNAVLQRHVVIDGTKYKGKKKEDRKLLRDLLRQEGATLHQTNYLLRQATTKRNTYIYDDADEAIKSAKKSIRKTALARLKRTQARNRKAKATPVNDREIFTLQSEHYGERRGTISYGDLLEGSYRPGFGGQPFYSSKASDFGGATIKSDYDTLAAQLDHAGSRACALAMISLIETGDYDHDEFDHKSDRAIADFIALTHVVENSEARQPGSDKLARACIRAIANGSSSFQEEFNRRDGNFFPARTAGRSGYGGQDTSRAIFERERKKSDKAPSSLFNEDIAERVMDMSESSEDESSD